VSFSNSLVLRLFVISSGPDNIITNYELRYFSTWIKLSNQLINHFIIVCVYIALDQVILQFHVRQNITFSYVNEIITQLLLHHVL